VLPAIAKLPRVKKNNGSSAAAYSEESSPALQPLFDVASSSMAAPTKIEQMQKHLAETIALVGPPLEVQLARINRGKPDDLSAQDYITDEFFAVAVRFCGIDGGRSERVPRLSCEIFSQLAPSKYHNLSASTMTRLMAEVGKAFPERYAGELQASSFLCVSLLRSSDETFGTSYAEKVGRCLLDFAGLLAANPAGPSPGEESELRRMETILKVKPLRSDPVVRRRRVVSEDRPVDRIFQDQPLSSEEVWRVADRPPEPERLPESHEVLPSMTRSAIQAAIHMVLRTFPSLHKIKNWLKAPIR